MATAAHSPRRKLSFHSIDDVLREAEQLASVSCRTTGNWTLGQIFDHLGRSADACFDGFEGVPVPWWARWIIAPLVRKRFLTHPMPSGIRVPSHANVLPHDEQVTVEAGLAHLRRALGRYSSENPTAPHPFLGRLRDRQAYIALNLRHAELHLSFVQPE